MSEKQQDSRANASDSAVRNTHYCNPTVRWHRHIVLFAFLANGCTHRSALLLDCLSYSLAVLHSTPTVKE